MFFFFFNVTATTEISASLHLLSLPDALPICVQRQNYLAPDESDRDLTTWRGSVRVSAQLAAGRDVFLLGFVNRRDHRLSVDRSGLDRDATTLGFLTGAGLDRSEEQTSELQSLMRISYAVFCLKKKQTDQRSTLRNPTHT